MSKIKTFLRSRLAKLAYTSLFIASKFLKVIPSSSETSQMSDFLKESGESIREKRSAMLNPDWWMTKNVNRFEQETGRDIKQICPYFWVALYMVIPKFLRQLLSFSIIVILIALTAILLLLVLLCAVIMMFIFSQELSQGTLIKSELQAISALNIFYKIVTFWSLSSITTIILQSLAIKVDQKHNNRLTRNIRSFTDWAFTITYFPILVVSSVVGSFGFLVTDFCSFIEYDTNDQIST